MKATGRRIEGLLAFLAESPGRMENAARGIEERVLQTRPDPGTWSINDILAHVRSCADVWGNTIMAMLAEDNPNLPDIHPRQWIKSTDYRELEFHESLRSFSRQRAKLLITLNPITPEAWSRSARIGGRPHTVFSQARRMAHHESEHCAQIEDLLRAT